jgi:hypothetical protein
VNLPDFVGLFIRPLEALEIPYMITGGVASVIFGDPRFTRDIDIVLQLKPEDVERLVSAFDLDDFYVPPLEALGREVARIRHGHFNIIHRGSALRADVYLLGDDPLHAWAFDRRRRIPLEDTAIWVAPPEYVILRKLEYTASSGSTRHLRDIAMMVRISGGLIDLGAVEGWVHLLGLETTWESAKTFEPD